MKFRKKFFFIILLLSLVLLTVSAVAADDRTFDDVQTAINNTEDNSIVYLNGTTYIGNGIEIVISDKHNITIHGGTESDPSLISTLDGKGLSRIMTINTDSNITFIGIKFVNGKQTDDGTQYNGGGAIKMQTGEGTIVTWENCTFINNTAENDGGVIYSSDWDNNYWIGCSFINNTAANIGGVIYGYGLNNWTNCNFINNTAATTGGAIACTKSIALTKCSFIHNTASGGGGAIWFIGSGANNNFTECNFTNNIANTGGAIYFSSSADNNLWNKCNFINNTAENGGGAIYFWHLADNNLWNKCNFINNKVPENTASIGSAILFYNESNNNKFIECDFTNNSGSAIYSNSASNNNWTKCDFTNNTGHNGGAIDFYSDKDNIWCECDFTNNTAYYNGGAIYLGSGSNNNLTDSNFTGNKAYSDDEDSKNPTSWGSAIYTLADLNINNCKFTDNKVKAYINCYFDEEMRYSTNLTVELMATDNILDAIYAQSCTVTVNGIAAVPDKFASGNLTVKFKDQDPFIIESGSIIDLKDYGLPEVMNVTFNGTKSYTNASLINKVISYGVEVLFNPKEFSGLVGQTVSGTVWTVISGTLIDLGYNEYYVMMMGESEEDYFEYEVNRADDKKITITLPDKPGTYMIAIMAKEVGEESAAIDIITVSQDMPPVPHNYELVGYDVVKLVNESKPYTVTLTVDGKPLAGQEILITLNGKEYTRVTDNTGKATLDLDLDVGNYTVTAKWNRFTTKNTIIVKPNPVNYELNAEDLTKYFGGPECYTVTLTDNGKPLTGETITITINGKEYTRVTDENGIASIAINLNPGDYTITASWNDLTVENTVTVKSTIHCDDFTKYYLNGTQYEAYVLDSEGNPLDGVTITFNIHGVFYHKEAHNGVVKLNINLLPGEYIITAYNDVTGEASSATVTVLPTLVGTDLNMTFQDGSKYECKLVDGQGNPVKGAELTFNIHGVFYHKITDDEGIARLDINLLPGEYIITAIYDELTMTSNIINVRDI